MSERRWPDKDPSDNLDYAIDWTLEPEETIVTSVWVVAGGLVKGVEAIVGASTVLWMSGGEPGNHTAQNTITTSAGRTYERTVSVRVRQL